MSPDSMQAGEHLNHESQGDVRLRSAKCSIPVRLSLGIGIALAVWVLALPIWLDLVLLLTVIALVWRAPLVNLAVLLVALFVAIGAAEILLRSGALGVSEYYREHERFIRPGMTYEPLVDSMIEMPHGDLLAIDPQFPSSLAQPRTVHFRTDRWGYRNREGYAGQKLAIVGDSFVVGNGTTQSDTIVERLGAEHGIAAYSLGHPADPLDYEYRANWFLHEVQPAARFWMFVYEGNDFIPDVPVSPASVPSARGYAPGYYALRSGLIRAYAPNFVLARWMEKMRLRLEERWRGEPRTTEVWSVGGHPMGIFKLHERVSTASRVAFSIDRPSEVWRRVDCVLFIPTKGRVYSQLADRPPYPPSAALAALRSAVPDSTRVIDLTSDLQRRALELLPTGAFLYWSDDTHWNGEGVTVAARAARECPRTLSAEESAAPLVRLTERRRVVEAAREALRGTVESVEVRSYVVLVHGWFTGISGAAQGGRIVVYVNGQVVAETAPKCTDSGSTTGLGAPRQLCRFAIPIPPQKYNGAGSQKEAYYLESSGKAHQLILWE